MKLQVQKNNTDPYAILVQFGAVLLILFTAFEVLEPVFTLGSISFTTSEIAVGFFLFTVAIWALREGSDFFRLRTLDVAVALVLFSNYLSIIVAEDKPSAFKFTLRLTYAALVFVGISRMPRRYRSHLVVAGAIAATCLVVSSIAVVENFFGESLVSVLAPFKERVFTFGAYYNVRATSTLPFPTVFSFYLELLLPVSLVFGLWLARKEKEQGRRRKIVVALLVASSIVMAAVAYSYTRSAYLAVPLALMAGSLVAIVFNYSRRVWTSFIILTVIFFAVIGVSAVFSNTMAFRLGLAEQEQRYEAEYTLIDMESSPELDDTFKATVHVKNTGSQVWKDKKNDCTFLVYYWKTYPELEKQDVDIYFVPVPRDIVPGDEADIQIEVKTPAEPGKYILTYELFRDAPFSHVDTAPLPVPVEFYEGGGSGIFTISEPAMDFKDTQPPPMSTPRWMLWKAALMAWKENPILGMGPDQFRRRYNEFLPDVEHDPRLASHNIYLEAMANTGIIGLAAMLYLLATAVVTVLGKIRDNSKGDSAIRLLSLGLFISLVVYICHGITEYPLWQTGILLMLFVLFGLISLIAEEPE